MNFLPTRATNLTNAQDAADPSHPALTQLLAPYVKPLKLLAMRQGLQESDALVVVNDVLFAAAQTLKTYDPEKGKFRNWLQGFLILRRKSHFRLTNKQNERFPLHPPDAMPDNPAEEIFPQDVLQEYEDSCRAELAAETVNTFRSLHVDRFARGETEEAWENVVRILVSELPNTELAASLGITEGTIRNRREKYGLELWRSFCLVAPESDDEEFRLTMGHLAGKLRASVHPASDVSNQEEC